MPQAQTSFSQGAAWIAEVDQVIGSTPDNGSRPFAILQENSVTFDWTTKSAYGQNQFPQVIARGTAKVTGKSSFIGLDMTLIANNLFGVQPTVGQVGVAQDEAGTIPASPAYTITVANAATYVFDLGVRYLSGINAGSTFTRVATPSAAGQYSVNFASGIYTFASADAGATIALSYRYNITTSGKLLTMTNNLQGFTPYFRMVMSNSISPNPPPVSASATTFALIFNACTATKMGVPRKVNDFTMIDVEWEAFSDGAGIVGYQSTLT